MLAKQIRLKHGVSEFGNLQVYRVTEISEDGKIISSTKSKPYTCSDVNNMEDFDQKSKDIVLAITQPDIKAEFELEKQIKTNMGIEKIITHDRIIKEDGKIEVRRITRIFDEGKEISKKYHRSEINPGDNSDNSDVISKALAKKLHTFEVIAEYRAKLEKLKESYD